MACKTCMYFHLGGVDPLNMTKIAQGKSSEIVDGQCRRNAPSTPPGVTNGRYLWPFVGINDWCGEERDKDER